MNEHEHWIDETPIRSVDEFIECFLWAGLDYHARYRTKSCRRQAMRVYAAESARRAPKRMVMWEGFGKLYGGHEMADA